MGQLLIQDELVSNTQDIGEGTNGVFDPLPAGCICDVTTQVNDPIFYVDIDMVVLDGPEYFIVPDRTLNGPLDGYVRSLHWAGDFSRIALLHSFIAPGEFIGSHDWYLDWEHLVHLSMVDML